ncbi:hypothetical protein QJQ45_013755 [Haematococcus lacustris]|nr:hypothetical protein QJQ45_013755 [Haematococcus lacustris]
MQRPLELCSWKDRETLPPVDKEYQQGYKRVDDRLPKARQRVKLVTVMRCPVVSSGSHQGVGEYLHPKWAEQMMGLYGAQEKVLERYFKKLEEEAAIESRKQWWTRKQLVVLAHAGRGKEYPVLGLKKLRNRAPKAQAQQPVAQ